MSELQLTRFGHACVRITAPGGTLVIDPGTFSEPGAVDGANALVFTHAHFDHYSAANLERAVQANPSLDVWASAETAAGIEGVSVRILTPGQTVRVAGFQVEVFGGRHAEIEPGQDAGDNVAVLVDGTVYHPGDSLVAPGTDVDTLLVPIMAPWSRLSEVLDFVRRVAPGRAFPIHDALLSDAGKASFDRHVGTRVPEVPYRRLAIGETTTLTP